MMSTISHTTIAKRLTRDRLRSYLSSAQGDLPGALALYDWNIAVGAALYEDIGRLEVVFRNAVDSALVAYGTAKGWPTVWYLRKQLFPGKQGGRALTDISGARGRAYLPAAPEVHGKVIAELSFGFWRYLCTAPYHTSMWVPALAAVFPHHPEPGNARIVRRDVERRIQRVHFLRNRIAHHEPIHQRDLAQDRAGILDVCGWICGETRTWLESTTRSDLVLTQRPGDA
jgi:hypothetical protein